MVKAYQEGRVSFKDVVFFQLEEYCDLSKNDPNSFAYQLYELFFKLVDAVPENVFFLNGITKNPKRECELFEESIAQKGGINFACVEVDSEASIGGNAPGSSLDSSTRLKTLTSLNINDRYYTRNGEQDAECLDICDPLFGHNRVLTMGLGTISKAEEVFALFLGSHSARALRYVVEQTISNMFPASILQLHPCACVLCDRYSMCTLRYTDVAYFAGIRENYQLVFGNDVTDFRSFVLPPNVQPELFIKRTEEEQPFLKRDLSFNNLRCRSPNPTAEEIDELNVCCITIPFKNE